MIPLKINQLLYIENGFDKPIDSFTIAIAFLTIVIAVATAITAYRQYMNDSYKIKIDLFDRRHKVYILLGKILAQLIQGLPSDDPKGFDLASQIGKCERMSKFLFPLNIQDEISEICENGMKLMELYRKLKPIHKGGLGIGYERDQLADEKSILFKLINDKFMNLENIFASEMNLTQ
jgi:hypothetical protein